MKNTVSVINFNTEEVKKLTKKQFVDTQPHLTAVGMDLEAEYDKIVGKKPKELNEGNSKKLTE